MAEEQQRAASNESLRRQLAALEDQREQLAALLGEDPQGPMLQLQVSWYYSVCLVHYVKDCVYRIIFSKYYHIIHIEVSRAFCCLAGRWCMLQLLC